MRFHLPGMIQETTRRIRRSWPVRGGWASRAVVPALVIFAMATGTVAQTPKWNLEVVSAWGGPVNAVQVDEVNNIAYIGSGSRFVVLDISNMAAPVEIGSLDLVAGVSDLVVRNGYAFVTARMGSGGLSHFSVLDVADPTQPQRVWAENDGRNAGNIRQVALSGDIAYLRLTENNFSVYDISDPRNPVFLGKPENGFLGERIRGIVLEFEIVGNLMYMVGKRNSSLNPLADLRVYDLSLGTPLEPVLLGEVDFLWEHYPTDVAIEGNRAYVIGDVSGVSDVSTLWSIDITDPTAPTLLGTFNQFGQTRLAAHDVDAAGDFVYVADYTKSPHPGGGGEPGNWEINKGLVVIDASDPAAMTEAATFKTHGSIRGVRVFGDTAYVFDDGEGLLFMDVTDPTNPVRVGNYYSPAELRRIDKVGDLLYVTDAWNGFTILDVSDPTVTPRVVGIYQTLGLDGTVNTGGLQDHTDIQVEGNLAYFAVGWGGLDVVDVSNPASPVLLGNFSFGDLWLFTAMDVTGTVAHMSRRHSGGGGWYDNIDVTHPTGMVHLAEINLGGSSTSMETSQGISHLNWAGVTTRLIDTTDPRSPFLVYAGAPPSVDSTRVGDLLYSAAATSNSATRGMYIHDVSNPSNPVFKSLTKFNLTGGIAVQNNRAYTIGTANVFGGPWGYSMLVFDVSDPSSPTLLASTHAGNTKRRIKSGLYVDEPYVYVVGGTTDDPLQLTGLTILESRGVCPCACDFDTSTGVGVCDIVDFVTFAGLFAQGDPCACDIDTSTGVGICDIVDFVTFAGQFAAGCP